MVETRPVSYEWSDHLATTLAMAVEPPKTILALMVGKMTYKAGFIGGADEKL